MDSVIINGYMIYEDGTIIGKRGKPIKPHIHHNRAEVKINLLGKGARHYTLTRLIYWVFHPEFDITNAELCVVSRTGNYINFTLDDLMVKPRQALIHGECHVHCAKLSNEDVDTIRTLYKGKAGYNQFDKLTLSQRDLAELYGVSRSNISLITRRKGRDTTTYKLLPVSYG